MNSLSVFLGLFDGPQQILVIAIIILLLFGGKKIPELMRGLGSGIKQFKDASKGEDKNPEDSQTNSTKSKLES
jgi:sec-independent protein translocase protein TatA